ncbi:MAG TPA: hypothetical protein VKZ79_10965 [Alphaproteobacteria bacterium]|nr:hypothetical protein [Alphaproteobacteria bacterium]
MDPIDPAAENRTLASLPALPRSLHDLVRYPAALNTYLQDWFGLRQQMVRTENWLRFTLFHEVTSPELLIGKHGRIFMSALPGNKPLSLINDVCGATMNDGAFLGTAYHITSLIERASHEFPDFTFVIIPGPSILYSEDLPRWAWSSCRGLKPSVERTLDDLRSRPDILSHIVYPIDVLQDLKRRYLIVPKRNLHWAGEGTLRYTEFLSEHRFGLQRTLSVPTKIDDWPSDLNRLNPGLNWVNRIPWPDPGMAGVFSCFGAECDPKADPHVIAPLDRFRTPNPNGRRLLLLGDSFADNVAGNFTEYFGEVWHIHFNLLAPLTRGELDQLIEMAFKQYRPDQVLYICNDFAIFYEPLLAQNFFWPDQRVQTPE